MNNKKIISLIIGIMCIVLSYGIVAQIKATENRGITTSTNANENQLRDEVLKAKEKYDNLYRALEEAEQKLEEERTNAKKIIGDHIKHVISPISRPDIISIVRELPKTRSGKILKILLKKISSVVLGSDTQEESSINTMGIIEDNIQYILSAIPKPDIISIIKELPKTKSGQFLKNTFQKILKALGNDYSSSITNTIDNPESIKKILIDINS